MSRISNLIEKSGWSFGIVENAIIILCEQLEIPWLENLQTLIKIDDLSIENYQLERILDILLKNGEILFKKIRSIDTEKLSYQIATIENEDQSFSREMCLLRRKVSKVLSDSEYEFSGNLALFDLWLEELSCILDARNASPAQSLIEENIGVQVSTKEEELVKNIIELFQNASWADLPLGEREVAILCLGQHFYSKSEFATASEYLVDAMEAGVQDPLIYYNYFVLAVNVGEFEAAMEGYKIAIESLPSLSLAPSDRYSLEYVIEKTRLLTTFAGEDSYEQRPVLIKVLNNPPVNVRKAIINAVKLKHAGIAEVYNFHEINKTRPCFAMQYLEGPTINEVIKQQGPIQPEQWLQMALQVTGAVAYAHDQGIIHGNITPTKLYFDQNEIKIADFGLYPLENWPINIVKQELPDLYFMAPEILASEMTPQSDVFSLAMTFYYMITGDIPHPIKEDRVPAVIWPIMKKATDISPDMRYNNATELLADLAQASETPMAIPESKDTAQISGVTSNRIISLEDGGTVVLPEKFSFRDGIVYSQLDESKMLLVPEGNFQMGSRDRPTEEPIHEVSLPHYLIDKYPVTNIQYKHFLDYIKKSGDHSKCHPDEPEGKDHTPKGWGTIEYKKYSELDNTPVVFIDWWDAWAYASWAGKSLPTEAQWEKAARGSDGRKYVWGNEEANTELANFANHFGRTTTVGSFPKGESPYGCMDMAGNVWEWCLDSYSKTFYQESPKESPVCTEKNNARSLRGGSWNNAQASLRASCRGCWVNMVRYAYIGFRCVRNL